MLPSCRHFWELQLGHRRFLAPRVRKTGAAQGVGPAASQVSDTTKQLMHKDHISLGGGDVAQSFISVGDQSSLLASFGREPKFWPVGCKQK